MDKVVLKNLMLNLVGLILPTFVSLVSVPLYIKLLGVSRYGVVALVWALIGYFSVLDLGMSMATENQISKAHAAHDNSVTQIFWSAFWMNLATGIAGGVVIYFGTYFYTTDILHLEADYQAEVLASLPWLAIAIPIANVSWVMAGAITAVERFEIFNINQTLGTFLFQLLPLASAYLIAPKLSVVLPAAVCARLIATLMLGVATLRVLDIRAVQWPKVAVVAGLFRYGRWVMLSSGLSAVAQSLDRVMIGSLLGARFVTFYTVPQNLVVRMNLLPSALLRTLFPRMSAGSPEAAHDMARQALAFLNGVFTPCVIVGLFILGPFLKIWVGPELASASLPVGRILIVAVWFMGQSGVLQILMLAHTGQASLARLDLFRLPFFAALLWFGISHFGIVGASCVVCANASSEYLLLLRVSRIHARPVLVDMASQLTLIVIASVLADLLVHLPQIALTGLSLAVASLGWSFYSSRSLREVVLRWITKHARGTGSGEPPGQAPRDANESSEREPDASQSIQAGAAETVFSCAACITTMNRPDTLAACLDALVRCTPAPVTIVVSDDSPDPAALERNRAIVARHPGVIHIDGPRRGVCANRNHALRRALRIPVDHVAFIDDDLLLPPDFFGTAATFYASLDASQRARTLCTGSRDDMAFGPVSLTFRGYFTSSETPGSVTVAAAVFPVGLFDAEWWDENIFFGSEDAELCLRARARGFSIAYVPELTSTHLAAGGGVLLREAATSGLTRYELCCEAARLYIGAKRYRLIEPNAPKLVAFLGIYFVHMAVSLTRRGALSALWPIVRMSHVERALWPAG